MLPKDLNILFNALSGPRVGAYRRYFGHDYTNEMVHGCYQWNEEVSSAFFKVITLIEIVMRNRMHSRLSQYYLETPKKVVRDCSVSYKNWAFLESATFGNAQSCNWYEAGTLETKSLSKVHNKTHHFRNKRPLSSSRRPSPDDVISSLTFGFWSSIIDKCPNISWGDILGDIYPKHRATASNQWHTETHKIRLVYRLQLVRDFRNRIAHHEPLWKLPNLLDERPPLSNQQRRIIEPATTTPAQSIRRLRKIYSKFTELLRWISQDIYLDLQASTIHQHLLWLCSEEGLNAHINRSKMMPVSIKPSRFKRELQSIIRRKKMIYVCSNERNLIAIQPIS